jgi:hypothetical protein
MYPVEFAEAMQMCKVRRYAVQVGKGENLTVDRMYIARCLRNQQQSRTISIATKKKIILFPIQPLMHGGSWKDSPGSNDKDPRVKANMQEICAAANKIFVVTKKNIKHNETTQILLENSKIFDRRVEDPLNYDVHFIENAEMHPHIRAVDNDDLEKFHLENPVDDCILEATAFVAQKLKEAKQRGIDEGRTVYDRKGRLHNVRIFPILFAARALQYWKQRKQPNAEELLKSLELSGGFDLLGSMHKLFYGYQQTVIGQLTERMDGLDLAKSLRNRIKKLMLQLHDEHSALCALTVEGKASKEIGDAMVRNKHGGLFPTVAEMDDHVCVLNCQLATNPVVGAKWINCGCCKMWYHPQCIDLSDEDYELYDKQGLPWYCSETECRQFERTVSPPNENKKRKASHTNASKRVRKINQ